jgi:hypothetical protein
MEWNCSKCKREIISEKKGSFCLECEWKKEVEKTEITPETIRNFMEKYWLSLFSFNREGFSDILSIGLEDMKTLSSYRQKKELEAVYFPRTKKNLNKMGGWARETSFNEYTAFLEKLFNFAQSEKIKRIRSDWKAEKNSNSESSFKVSSIIIEKKTAEELEKEE